ncbi:T9SS type A sorting domain-containing protein [Candidatus Woesearchaeota archaeon]|jgi:hypothetical protein|nr:T9SS type A sorting domain-containing protein [Candidatus Woesearchaeota archaeon]
MSVNTNRREFLRKALISGFGVALAPHLLGKASQLVEMVGGQDNPSGIVTGGFDPNDPKYGIKLTESEVDWMSMLKSGNDGWYGDQVVNPYIRPNNVSEWEFVGSMLYHNGVPIQPGEIAEIDKSLHSYILDLNGDGNVNQTDKDIFDQVVNEGLTCPSNWDLMETVNERVNWFEKMVANYDDTASFREGWTCGEYMTKFGLGIAGLENAEEAQNYNYLSSVFDFNKNGRVNLPVYTVNTKAKDGNDHTINALFVGSENVQKDTPEEFDSWYFIEPQTGERVFPGNFSMRAEEGDLARVERLCYNEFGGNPNIGIMPVVKFDLNKGNNPEAYWKHPDLVLERPKSGGTGIITTHYSQLFEINNLYPNQIGKGEIVNLEYTISPNYSGKGTSLEVIEMSGKRVKTFPLNGNYSGKHKTQINTSEMNLSSGQYLYRLINGNTATKAKKLIVR